MIVLNKILLIDDDEITNFINEVLITSMDITNSVTIASSGRIALNYMEENCNDERHDCPDLILLDINMPAMNGFEFLTKMKTCSHRYSSIPVLMLTSSKDPRDEQSAKSHAIAGYLVKPLTPANLLEALQTIKTLER